MNGKPSADVQSFVEEQLNIKRHGVQAALGSQAPELRLEAARERIRRSAEQLAAALSAVDALDSGGRESAASSAGDALHGVHPGELQSVAMAGVDGGLESTTCDRTPHGAGFPAETSSDGDGLPQTVAHIGTFDATPPGFHAMPRSATDLHFESLLALTTAAVGPMHACVDLLEERCPLALPSADSAQKQAFDDSCIESASPALVAALGDYALSLQAVHASARDLRHASDEEVQACEACVEDQLSAVQLLLHHLHDDHEQWTGKAAKEEGDAARLSEQLLALQHDPTSERHM